ncbi:MAG: hypothetical protein WBC33_10480 [Conexibacter sp.]
MSSRTAATLTAIVLVLAAGCGSDDGQRSGLPQGSAPVELDPAAFATRIEHPYWPMAPGSRWIYRETARGAAPQRVVVTVTAKTKRVANGIRARVVHDVVSARGALVEDTFDWYAQDRDGNVWYLGEDTTEYEHGRPVTTAGSWEAGVDGAQAGVVMPAMPRVGMRYRQEYYAGRAEDRGEILSVDEQVEVPFGHFTAVLMTKDFTPLEPRMLEHKLYARGVGPVLALTLSGGSEREELLRYER